jgi:predicted acyl esterase
MWQTGVNIPAGHRLRLVVLSTLFPDTDRNLNTGGSIAHGTGIVVANQIVFHEPGNESYIVLPVVGGS